MIKLKNLQRFGGLALPYVFVGAIVSVAIAIWSEVLGKTFGVAIWTAISSFLTSIGTLVALSVLGYNIWKDRKAEADKFEQAHSYVDAFCDEIIASVSPITLANKSNATHVFALPALLDTSLAEKILWDQYKYFVYPTNFNFRHLLFSLRTLLTEHSMLVSVVSKISPMSPGEGPKTNAEVVRKSNELLRSFVEQVVVSAHITRLLDGNALTGSPSHALRSGNINYIETRSGIVAARIREICEGMRCKIVE